MDNNKKYLSNNITIEKLKNKGKNDNKNIVQISLFNHSNNNNSNCTTFPDLMNKNKNYGKNFLSSNQNCENIKLKSNKSKKEESINNNQMTKKIKTIAIVIKITTYLICWIKMRFTVEIKIAIISLIIYLQ